MKKYKRNKKLFFVLLVLLLVLFMGLGYAVLTQQLKLNNTVSYDAMKWNVGFTEVNALEQTAGAIVPTVSISENKKSISISCDFGTNTSSKQCVAVAKITNDSTFNVSLSSLPSIEYDSALIDNVYVKWYESEEVDGVTNSYEYDITSDTTIDSGNSIQMIIKIVSKELTVNTLPSQDTSIPITITLDWHQVS